jgi:hypothetical protein
MRFWTKFWALLILCFFSLGACTQADTSLPFDPQIEGMTLVREISGEEAMQAINELHGMPIHVLRGFIFHYQAVDGKAVVWVSEAASRKLATEQIDVMIEKMKKNKRSPFSRFGEFEENGMNVIAFNGMGQVHYVFKIGRWVYWVSAGPRSIEAILEHIEKTG